MGERSDYADYYAQALARLNQLIAVWQAVDSDLWTVGLAPANLAPTELMPRPVAVPTHDSPAPIESDALPLTEADILWLKAIGVQS